MEAIERYSTSNDLLTVTIVLILLLLVLSKNLFQHRFEDFVSLFKSGKFMVIKSREHKTLHGFNVIMLSVHVLSISLFLFVLYRIFIGFEANRTAVLFLRIITAYSFFILLKITVEKIIANVFDIDEIANHYLFQKHTYRNFISMLFLPIIIFLIYTPAIGTGTAYAAITALIAAGIYAIYRVIKKNIGLISRNWFYFILYLCALEITPYFILYKLITVNKV